MGKAQLTVNGQLVGEIDAIEIAKGYLKEGAKESAIIRELIAAGFQEERVNKIMMSAIKAVHSEKAQREQDEMRIFARF